MGIISDLKDLRHDLWKKAQKRKKRNEDARDAQRRRAKLLRDKRERRKVLYRRVRALEEQYNNLPAGADQAEAHKLKARMIAARQELREMNDEINDVAAKFQAVRKSINQRTRQIRYTLQTRIPHVSRRIKRAKREAEDKGWSPTGGGIVTFDGKPTVEWLAYRMQVARAAGWDGYLVSGWRSPAYSTQLCYGMCGQPSCPGQCAGAASNHAKSGYGGGAIDVSDYYTFGALMRTLNYPGIRIFNALGAQDPVHFSASGR